MKHLALLKIEAMEHVTLHRLASSFHCFIAVNAMRIRAEIKIKQCRTFRRICESKDNKAF
jgi:hypothetical protein